MLKGTGIVSVVILLMSHLGGEFIYWVRITDSDVFIYNFYRFSKKNSIDFAGMQIVRGCLLHRTVEA